MSSVHHKDNGVSELSHSHESRAILNAGLRLEVQASSNCYELFLKMMVERFDPSFRSWTAGPLLELLQFDFVGEVLVKLETLETRLSQHDRSSEIFV